MYWGAGKGGPAGGGAVMGMGRKSRIGEMTERYHYKSSSNRP